MLCKRIIACLDVKDGRVVKGRNFTGLRDAGDPVGLARRYYEQGADEIVFLDISASKEERKTIVEVARRTAIEVFVPFTIGGGVGSVEDARNLLYAGADKVAVNTSAVANPSLITAISSEFGKQAVVVAIDAKKKGKRWGVFTFGGSVDASIDAVLWAKKAEKLGAGEILLTSIDQDGTNSGFDIELTRAISSSVRIPVIASGGAGSKRDFLDIFRKTRASGALAAGVFHYGKIRITSLKDYLLKNGVDMREA